MEWERLMAEVWQHHRGKLVGAVLGLAFGVLTATLGFWKTLFISFCIVVGYFLGKRIDENYDIREMLGKIFREK